MTLLYILLGLAIVIATFVIIVASRAPEFRVKRSADMNAPPAAVFAEVNDLHKWETWSPWAKIDPNMKQTYAGAPAGTGAIYSWNGNKMVGEGRMTIVESRPSELVRIKLEFMRPFAGINDVQLAFEPKGAGTHMTWTMDGKCNFITKAFGLFVSMDRMIGKDFEKGLASLKQIVDKRGS